ncbi:NUDIX hydrolase [Mangrovihabitans endophyticus]|uniref:Nudix hydrolase domain-containing protein n=1 Tax=Mangrovihabitans endophyticus TaxID=1751298 RepID=A0A8J3BUW1_9ACTN|nr:NUDIX domain-containing protein [Mangrovihabitans endophyticus]GGK79233.1 hypothetical protein GCM10012284_11570 [Mangrovihabitans endophyticus]
MAGRVAYVSPIVGWPPGSPSLVMYRPLFGIDGIEFRLHRTVLYNSIYRADDQLLVNTHIYSFTAAQAPEATSVVPSANVVVVGDDGSILLIRRSDNDNWALPGGGMDLGESLPEAAVRETVEETGVEVEITGLVGLYTDPRHVILYTSNHEARQEFSVVFTARPIGGTPTPSDETSEVRWTPPDEIGALPMDRSMRMRIDHFLTALQEVYLG